MLKVEANGKVYANDEICTHEGGPLDEGELNGLLSIALSIQPLSPFQVTVLEEEREEDV